MCSVDSYGDSFLSSCLSRSFRASFVSIGYLVVPGIIWCFISLLRFSVVCYLVEPSVICYAIMFIARFIFRLYPPTYKPGPCTFFYRPSITHPSCTHTPCVLGKRNYLFFRFLTISHMVAPTHSQRGSINGIDNTVCIICVPPPPLRLLLFPSFSLCRYTMISNMNQLGGLELSQKWKKYAILRRQPGPFSIPINCIIFLLNSALAGQLYRFLSINSFTYHMMGMSSAAISIISLSRYLSSRNCQFSNYFHDNILSDRKLFKNSLIASQPYHFD